MSTLHCNAFALVFILLTTAACAGKNGQALAPLDSPTPVPTDPFDGSPTPTPKPKPLPTYPSACTDAVVPFDKTGDDACGEKVCVGVLGTGHAQSLHCGTAAKYGDLNRNAKFVARCCNTKATLKVFDREVPLNSSGNAICRAEGGECVSRTVGSSGFQSLYCGTSPSSGDPNSNGWMARCVKPEPANVQFLCDPRLVAAGESGNEVCARSGSGASCTGVLEGSGLASAHCGQTIPATGRYVAQCCSL